jgi:hypothetical protein
MSLLPSPSVNAYDAYYYQHGCGLPYERSEHWARFFGGIADQIVAGIGPRSVMDAGCAMGFLVEALRDRGVEAFGCDISDYAISRVREDIRPFCRVGSVLEPLPRRYDLIVCIEVLEHLPPEDGPQAIANFCRSADDVLFSSTPSDFHEITHVNVRPVEYWAEQFARQYFFRDVDFDATVILPWSARFRRSHEPVARTVRNYERKYWLLQNENQELRVQLRVQNAEMRSQIERLQAEVVGRGRVIEQITNGLGWRLLQALAPIRRYGVPPGSWRERAVLKLLGAGRKAPKAGEPAA